MGARRTLDLGTRPESPEPRFLGPRHAPGLPEPSSGLAHLDDLDRRVILAMAAFTSVVLASLELADDDLLAAVGLKDLSNHGGAGEVRGTNRWGRAVAGDQ